MRLIGAICFLGLASSVYGGAFLARRTTTTPAPTRFPNLVLPWKPAEPDEDKFVYPSFDTSLYEMDENVLYLEDDVIVEPQDVEEYDALYAPVPDGLIYKNIHHNEKRKWKKKGSIVPVPFTFHSSLTASMKSEIFAAIAAFEASTCIRFIPRNGEYHYVRFKKSNKKNASRVGRGFGRQTIKLKTSASTGTTIHEMMHAIGFYHEHSRADRDQFVEIVKKNITFGKKHNFKRRNKSVTLGSPYDFASIMHYPLDAFSKNGKDTIKVLSGNPSNVGQRVALSLEDKKQIRKHYDCGFIIPNDFDLAPPF